MTCKLKKGSNDKEWAPLSERKKHDVKRVFEWLSKKKVIRSTNPTYFHRPFDISYEMCTKCFIKFSP